FAPLPAATKATAHRAVQLHGLRPAAKNEPSCGPVRRLIVMAKKSFERDMNYIPDRITKNARVPEYGPVKGELWPVEPGRYRLIAAAACPWANRTLIVRKLLGLEDVISVGMPGPTHDERSWTFDLDPDGRDPVLGIERLQEAYFRRIPNY